ncbi:uncharacterized protein LOC127735738 [Mytilus californianus]|uniref:uncharacterized protein LOC127735738 n=1 Tax=Mytilus californianus TaxID=6549 RepID=UPI0022455243|nr:uncharacterized protein LOC127735738 [Mytilus californianus]
MAEKFDLLLMNGPSFAGRRFYSALLKSHSEIIPKKMFLSDNTLGLRDVIMEVISMLKENEKVVVNDENCNKSTWESYINMVKKKTPSKSIAVVSVQPKHGLKQLYWSRQYYMLDNDGWEPLLDSYLTKWFDSSTEELSYHVVDDPTLVEDLKVIVEEYPVILRTNIQPDIPGLFFQWEAVFCEESLKAGIVKTCQLWFQKSQHGRIFILLDLTKHPSYMDSSFQEEVKNCMKGLVKKLEDVPVYLYSVDKEAVKYTVPPSPGLLATIQGSHGIDLFNKNTVMLFQDQPFSKMADLAGVKHVNASKVLQKPTLILNKLIFTTPRQPNFLQDMEFRVEEDQSPCLPLYNLKDSFHGNCLSEEVSQGIKASLYGSNIDSIKNFQKSFDAYLMKKEDPSTQLNPDDSTHVSSDDEVVLQNKSFSRELPKWMLGTSKSTSSSSLSSHRSDSVNSTASADQKKAKSTVYVMSEKELVEVATEIMKQAGRGDILHRIEERELSINTYSEKKDNNETNIIIHKTESNSTAMVEVAEENGVDPSCISASSKKRRIFSKKKTTSSTGNRTEDILDLDFMDSEDIKDTLNVENSGCESGKRGKIVSEHLKIMEINPCRQAKQNYSSNLFDTFPVCEEERDIEMKSKKNFTDETCILSEEKNPDSVKSSNSYLFTKLTKRLHDQVESKCVHINESCSSRDETSLNIDPTELFQNLPEEDSERQSVTFKPRKKLKTVQKCHDHQLNDNHNNNNVKSSLASTKPKKPDLSFLDDIFG